MNLMNQLAPVKNHIVQQAMGLSGNLPKLLSALYEIKN